MKVQATRLILATCAFAACALSAGCQLVVNGVRTVGSEFTRKIEDKRETKRNWDLAEAAWAEEGGVHSPDFAQGFKEGFVDYLYAGGAGEPPLLPPKRYQSFRYENPQGAQAIRDWFAGFRSGAAAAAASGYRDFVVVPSRYSAPHLAAGQPHVTIPEPVNSPDTGPEFPPIPQLDKGLGQKDELPQIRDLSKHENTSGFEVLPPLPAAAAPTPMVLPPLPVAAPPQPVTMPPMQATIAPLHVASAEPEEIEAFAPPYTIPPPHDRFGPRKRTQPPRANYLEVIMLFQAADLELSTLLAAADSES